jgi:NADH-quinone oxidoreductase subunit C
MSELHDNILQALEEHSPGAVISSGDEMDFPVFHLQKNQLIAVLTFLKQEKGFNFLTTMCGIHYPEQGDQEFALMYQLHNMPDNKRIRIKTYIPEQKLEIATITDLWDAANWMERQEYDFFGVNFIGHPNLIRILNMEDITFFPMRKDFALEDPTRDDKNDSMFGR